MKNIASFEEFCKMGVSTIVKKHYSGSSDKAEDLSDPKDSVKKGTGKVDHTEKVKADDLGDPKNTKMNEGFSMNGEGDLSLENIENVKKSFQKHCKGAYDEIGTEFEVAYSTDPETKYHEYEVELVSASSAIEAFLKVYSKEGYLDIDLEGDHNWKKTKKGWVFELEKDSSDPYHIFIAYINKIK